jgi:hypothetical protein
VGLGDSSGSVEGSLDLDLLRVERRVGASGTPSLAFLGGFLSSSVALRLGDMFTENWIAVLGLELARKCDVDLK